MKINKINLLLCTSIFFAFTISDIASAQEAENDEIIVTARRKEENIKDVPISVSAIKAEDLLEKGAQDITFIEQVTPNMTFEVSRGSNTTLTAFIRGVGQQDPVAGFEQGVGVYIDDVYMNRPQGAVVDLFDVERVEVLRGPQGTLYGRNTIGGAVKYVSKRYSEDYHSVKFTYGTYNQADLVLKGAMEVSDGFAITYGLGNYRRDGFGDNLTLGIDNYNKKLLAGRVGFEFMPNDNIFSRLTLDFLEDKSNARQGGRLIPSIVTKLPVLNDEFDTRAGLNIVPQYQEAKNVNWTIEGDVNSNWTVKNILAYHDDNSTSPIDFDSLASADIDVPVIYENDQLSEELQLLYNNGNISAVIGAYYLSANSSNKFDVILGETGKIINLSGLNATTFGDVAATSASLFADVTYDLNDEWSISAGGRYTSESRDAIIKRETFIGGFTSDFGGTSAVKIATTSDFDGTVEFTDFSPRLSATYKMSPDKTLYASYSEGFKAGGFDPRCATSSAPDLNGNGVKGDADKDDVFEFCKFDPEEVNSLEVGFKTAGRFNTALAVFYNSYENVQIPGSVGVDTDGDGVADTFAGVTTNAAEATISGLEFEGSGNLAKDAISSGDSFDVNWALGLINAEFNKYIDATGNDVSNDRVIQNTPDVTLSASLNYQFMLTNYNAVTDMFLSFSHRGDSSQFETKNKYLDQDAYTLFNAGVTMKLENDLNVSLIGTNLSDERYIAAGYNFVTEDSTSTSGFVSTLGIEGTLTGFYGNPRQVVLSIEKKF